jgi:hypothetical protein
MDNSDITYRLQDTIYLVMGALDIHGHEPAATAVSDPHNFVFVEPL